MPGLRRDFCFDEPRNDKNTLHLLVRLRADSVEFAKMYPEQNAEARFRNAGKCKIYAYCIKFGLFELDF